MPEISIITPVYNAEKSLLTAAESVLGQSFADFEWIPVDDGSSDGSAALCDELAARDSRVKPIHQPNGGVSAARNAGLEACHGRFILFLDADDFLLPGALQSALDTQTAHPDRWLLWRYTLGDAGRDGSFWGCEAERAGIEEVPVTELASLYRRCFISMPWNKLYRADIAKRLRFDTDYSLGEDLLFGLDYLSVLRSEPEFQGFALLHKNLTHYTVGESDSTLSTRYLPDYCGVWERLFARLNDACQAVGCPEASLRALRRDELTVLAEGAADILRRDPAPGRKAKAKAALASPAAQALAAQIRAEGSYSPYLLPVQHRLTGLVLKMADSRAAGTRLFGRMDWLGWYLLGGKRERG